MYTVAAGDLWRSTWRRGRFRKPSGGSAARTWRFVFPLLTCLMVGKWRLCQKKCFNQMGDFLCRGLMRVYKSSSSLNNKGKINWLWQFGHGGAIWGSSAHCIFCKLYGAFCFLLLTQFKNNSIILHFPLSCKYYRIFPFLVCIAKISKQLKLNYNAEKPN